MDIEKMAKILNHFKPILRILYYKFYNNIFLDYSSELEKAIGDCTSVLDVGCGSHSPIRAFSRKFYSIGVDVFPPSIEISRNLNIHDEYCILDALDLSRKYGTNSVDCVLASDLIEHLTKREGAELLRSMENIARKKVIVFTPNGFLFQKKIRDNPWQVHKSGWSVEELKKCGFKIIGINGWKALREEQTRIKLWPYFLWRILSDMTQKVVKHRAESAFQLLCVKDIKKLT